MDSNSLLHRRDHDGLSDLNTSSHGQGQARNSSWGGVPNILSSRGPTSQPAQAASRGCQRLGTAELGPYSFEEQMPTFLRQQLQRGAILELVCSPTNETRNIFTILAQLCEQDQSLEQTFLSHTGVKHVVVMPGEEELGRYRNIQMLMSYIRAARYSQSFEHFQGTVPTVLKLQDLIEEAWDKGINIHRRIETGGIKGTRKWIGTPEVQALLISLSIPHETHVFKKVAGNPAHEQLLKFVEDYFAAGSDGPPVKVHNTMLPPLYLQHQGYSLTIFGFERKKNGTRSLLVFDPGVKPSSGIREPIEREESTHWSRPMLSTYRKGETYLHEFNEFELIKLIPLISPPASTAANFRNETATMTHSVIEQMADLAFCQYCRAIPWDKLPSEEDLGWSHQPSLDLLEASAATCKLCSLIWDIARELRQSVTDEVLPHRGDHQRVRNTRLGHILFQAREEWQGTVEVPIWRERRQRNLSTTSGNTLRPWLYGSWWALPLSEIPEEGAPAQLIGIGVRVGVQGTPEDALGNTSDIVYRGTGLRVCTDERDPLACLIPGRIREIDSSSEAAFHRIQSWLHVCERQHPSCRLHLGTPENIQLPSRVLNLGNGISSDTITLLETCGQRARYMTLSHCWGGSHVITTEKSNLQDHKRGISISGLPKTFRDAVLITRKLNVQYLWIDSLCIIQDDKSDWERECTKMADVYAYSYLTIAASSSMDDSTGCFPRRTSSYIPSDCRSAGHDTVRDTRASLHVTIPWIDGRVSKLYIFKEWLATSNATRPIIYRIGACGSSFDPLSEAPLNTRGWTLQERLLSPRTLHYGSDQMYWECRQSLLAEDGARFEPRFCNIDIVSHWQQIPFSQHGLTTMYIAGTEGDIPSSFIPTGRWYGGWLAQIQNYSQRALTVETDKLPALSGLARKLAQITRDTYWAGLWKSHIIEDLHWRVYACEETSTAYTDHIHYTYGSVLCDVKLPQKYRAPSWSWAAVDANIRFVGLHFKHLVAECINGHTTPSGIDEFGSVRDGWIKIEAPLLDIRDPHSENEQGPLYHGTPVEIHFVHGIAKGAAFFDDQPYFPCSALFLDITNSLVLKATEKDGEFKRIGVAKFIRTMGQRVEAPDAVGTLDQPLGPISEYDVRKIVTIV